VNEAEQLMATRNWAVLLIAFGLALGDARGSDPPAPPGGVPAKFARAKLEAARRTFEQLWKDREWRQVETPYLWSRRWLEAQCQVSDQPRDRVAACQRHLDRMRDLAEMSRALFKERLVRVAEVHATEYYIAEAEEWLARAKARAGMPGKKR
jgi:hypothetical protein